MIQPPKILQWLLNTICPNNRQDLKGDFLELYQYRREAFGKFKANAAFLLDVFTAIPLKFIVKENITSQSPKSMVFTNLKIARRSLVRNKLYTMINLIGLSVSLAACLLITMFVRDEMSFDKHFKDNERIYRLGGNYLQGGGSRTASAATTFMLQPLIQEKLAKIEATVRVDFHTETVFVDDKQYLQSSIIYTDSTFFDVFSLPFISGDPSTVLHDPTQVVIDRQTAVKFFGDKNPIGRSIVLKDKHFTVSGVMENMPENSHITAHMVLPISGVKQWYQDWVLTNITGRSVYTYIKVNKDVDAKQLEAQSNKIIAAAWPDPKSAPLLFLQPIASIHLGPAMQGEVKPNGTEKDIYIFTITAIIILLLACINYINLSMAGALPRSREAGIRRVLGSTVRMVVAQFQTESFLILTISGLFASLLAWSLMPLLNQISGKSLAFHPWNDPLIGFGLLIAILVITLIAGTVPALTLLRSGTIRLLSGKLEFKPGRYHLSNMLIVFQFSIAVALIASTLIVMDQIRFIRNTDIGINTEQLVLVPFQTPENAAKYEVFRSELLKNPAILGVTASTNKVTGGVHAWRSYMVDPAKGMTNVSTVTVGYDFFETVEARVLEGRSFSRDFPSDLTGAYIVNEAAVELLGLEKPVGSFMFGMAFNDGDKWTEVNAHIIGVVKDFHFSSLHSKVEPVVFSLASEITPPLAWMEVRIKGSDTHGTIEAISSIWSRIAPSRPFEFEFMDDALQNYYAAEQQFMKLFVSFSLLSIFLGALGLFGLTAFMTKRRTKEIGIRKVIGASTSRLIGLLSTDFLKLVMIANVIGLPVAWYYMNLWLQNFTIQTSFKWWIFVGTTTAAVAIAFISILYHSLKVSNANPVKALRSE